MDNYVMLPQTMERYFKMASAFDVFEGPPHSHLTVRVEKRAQRNGDILWGVYESERSCFNKSTKKFEFESQPSSRTDEDLADTRFTFQQAMNIAEQVADQFREGVRKWQDGARIPFLYFEIDSTKINI